LRREIKRKGRHLASLDDEARHIVRKKAKKLRYAAEFFASLFERKREQRRHKHLLSRLEALQNRLGMLNDLAAIPGLFAKAGLSVDAAAAFMEGGPMKKELLDLAEAVHQDLVDTRKFW
jgi:CHAD domain-containing protein